MSLTKFFKENLVLCFGIVLPIFMMAAFFLVTSLHNPAQPKYDFIVSTRGNYYGQQASHVDAFTYVQNNRLYASYTVTAPPYYHDFPKLYVYEVATKRLRQLDFVPPDISSINGSARLPIDSAQSMLIDPSPTSPDGYQFTYSSNDSYNGGLIGDLIIGGSYSYGPKLKNQKAIVPLDFSSQNGQYEFVGWIVGSRS